MGLRVRKSFTIAKGVRLNLGKSGVGLSFGTKGLRYNIHSSGRKTASVGIPGTGIYYTTSSRGHKRKYSSNAYDRREHLKHQREQQKLNETQENILAVKEYNNLIDIIKGIHKECDEYVDWKHVNSIGEPFNPAERGPNESGAEKAFEAFKPTFIEKIFKSMGEKRRNELQAAVKQAKLKDIEQYEDWKDLNILSERVLQGDIDAYFLVIDEMNPLDDLLDFGSDFEFGANDGSAVYVEFRVKSKTVVPDYVLSLTPQTGKLSKKNMTKTQYYDLVQDYVCSCAIRIARDLMALIPVERVVVHAVDSVLDTATGHEEDITILSVIFDREGLGRLNFELIDPSDALQNFRYNMKFLKTAGFKAVERLSE